MKSGLLCVGLVLIVGGAGAAWSQQRPGGNGPLPGDAGTGGGGWDTSSSYEPSYSPPATQPYVSPYELTFGALAKAGDDRQFAFSVGRYSASEAAAEAMAKCREQSGKDCTVVRTFCNQCVTLASPAGQERLPASLSKAAMATETTSADSRRVAVAGCEKIYGGKCRVNYMACASPSRRKEMEADRWSAIAIDPASSKLFPAIGGGYNPASARAAAYDACQRDGGSTGDCQVLDHFPAGECRSLARSQEPIREGDYAAIIRERPDPAVAMRQCEDKAGSACKIVWHGCS